MPRRTTTTYRFLSFAGLLALVACAGAATLACDDGAEPAVFVPTLRVPLPVELQGEYCAEVAVTQRGATETRSTCDTLEAVDHLVFACSGPATVTMHLLPRAGANPTLENPCGDDGCALSADCDPEGTTDLEWTFVVMPRSEQGFFDIEISLRAPGDGAAHLEELGDFGEFCVDLAVDDGAGERMWARESVCSAAFGDRLSLDYVGPCSTANGPDNRLHVRWRGAFDRDGAPLEDVRLPCGDGEVCAIDARCEENDDTSIRIHP